MTKTTEGLEKKKLKFKCPTGEIKTNGLGDWESRVIKLWNYTPTGKIKMIRYIRLLLATHASEVRKDLLQEMLEECDKTENENGRLLIEGFKKKL